MYIYVYIYVHIYNFILHWERARERERERKRKRERDRDRANPSTTLARRPHWSAWSRGSTSSARCCSRCSAQQEQLTNYTPLWYSPSPVTSLVPVLTLHVLVNRSWIRLVDNFCKESTLERVVTWLNKLRSLLLTVRLTLSLSSRFSRQLKNLLIFTTYSIDFYRIFSTRPPKNENGSNWSDYGAITCEGIRLPMQLRDPSFSSFCVITTLNAQVAWTLSCAAHSQASNAVDWSSSSLLLSSLELSDTNVYESSIRALLGTASNFCKVMFLILFDWSELSCSAQNASSNSA